VAGSGDLGYTYGKTAVMEPGRPGRIRQPGLYFRIWERQGDGPFKIVFDLVKALPPALPVPPAGRPGAAPPREPPPPAAPPPPAEPPPPGAPSHLPAGAPL
jgi:hypothetical protein